MKSVLLFFLFILISISSLATPTAIFMIRHAEKPPMGPELSEKGWARAQALPQIFSRPEFKAYGAPTCIIGMAAKKYDGSIRALQTLKYVSEFFQVPITDSFNKDEFQEMVKFVLTSSQCENHLVVIAWEHSSLEDIAALFGIEPKPKWPGSTFDRIWFLTPAPDAWSLADLPQNLLPGDSTK